MTITRSYLPIFRGIDMTLRRIPQFVVDSGVSGPTIWLTAAIHGNEVTGTAVIQSIIKRFQSYPLQKGKIYALPILNPSGFEVNIRQNVYAGEDLNRNFGCDASGSTSERLAYIILTAVLTTKPDIVIDLHTDSMNSIAYIILDDLESAEHKHTLKSAEAVAHTLGITYAYDTEKSAGYPLESSFSGQLIKHGIPAMTIELGGPLVVNESFRKIGLEALWHVLYTKKMVDFEGNEYPRAHQPKAYRFYHRIDTGSTGIIDYRVSPGDKVKKNQILAKIRNVFGDTIEVIRSPIECIVFSHEDQSVTFPGQDLFTLAY